MLSVTDGAKQALQFVLTNNEDKSFSVLHLIINGSTNFTLVGEKEVLHGDEIVEADGMELFLIEREFTASL